MRPVPIMTVLIKQTSSFQSIGKCGSHVVCHGAQRHAVVCLDHTHLGECFLNGDGVDLAKEGIDERLAGNLDIAGALYVAVDRRGTCRARAAAERRPTH